MEDIFSRLYAVMSSSGIISSGRTIPPVSSFLASFIVSLDVSALYVLSLSCACTVEKPMKSAAMADMIRKRLVSNISIAI